MLQRFADELYLSVFTYASYAQPKTLLQRLRYYWHILWTGLPYDDEICLDSEKARELKDWLSREFPDSRQSGYRPEKGGYQPSRTAGTPKPPQGGTGESR